MKCSIKKFSEMYETVYRDLYRYALCLMKNPQEAEDAVSEAVIAAYENIHKLKKEEAFKSWIFTILTNKCKKRLKKALKETPGREEELPEQATAPDYDLAIDVKKAFFVLSEEEQILVGLSVFGGYCSQEIGEMVMERLRQLDEVSYVRFASVYREFKDVNSFMQELRGLMDQHQKKES